MQAGSKPTSSQKHFLRLCINQMFLLQTFYSEDAEIDSVNNFL